MGFVKYTFQRIKSMNKKQMWDKIDVVREKTGRSRAGILFDMFGCALRHGAGYMDYWLFEMYNMNGAQRATVLTRGRNNAIVRRYNQKDYFHCFTQKDEFNEKFDKYLKRSWIIARDDNRADAEKWISEHDEFIAKPLDGGCGRGVEKIKTAERGTPSELYDYVLANGKPVLEEVIKQHPAVSAIYPCAINTVRVVTLLKDEKVAVLFTYFRIGNGGRVVDNFNSGGMVAPVDEKTGIVLDSAIDKKKNLYAEHPMTGTKIKGFQFPYWEEVLSMCREAAHVVPEMGYIGWDVAITPDGPCFVEANEFPGHDIYQLPEHTPDKIGVYGKYRNAVYE